MKNKIQKKTIIAVLLIILLIGIGYFAYQQYQNKNTTDDVVASQQHEPTPEVNSSVEQPQPSAESENAPSSETEQNPAPEAQPAPSAPKSVPAPQQGGGSASSGQATPAPQQPSTPQPTQPQQQAPSRPQWKKVVVGYCDVTIGYSSGYDQNYKNAEACFQKVLPEKPVWCGVAYAPTSGYDCRWNGRNYSIDENTNYVYYLVRA